MGQKSRVRVPIRSLDVTKIICIVVQEFTVTGTQKIKFQYFMYHNQQYKDKDQLFFIVSFFICQFFIIHSLYVPFLSVHFLYFHFSYDSFFIWFTFYKFVFYNSKFLFSINHATLFLLKFPGPNHILYSTFSLPNTCTHYLDQQGQD